MRSTPLQRGASALAGLVAVTASALVIGSGFSEAAVDGSLAVTPATGTDQTQIFVTTSKACTDPRATNIQAKVFGSGFPAGGQNVVSNSAISAYPKTANGGYTIPFGQNMKDFAAQQPNPVPLSGRYDITLICRTNTSLTSLGDFTGFLTFTSATAYTAPSDAATASSSSSASASATASASSSTTTSASASASATASASVSASASASVTASPSPSASRAPSATPTSSESTTASPTRSATVAPSSTAAAPLAAGTATVTDGSGAPVNNPTLRRGDRLNIDATGFSPGEVVSVTFFSHPRVQTPVTADAQGLIAYSFVVPADAELGAHRLQFVGARTLNVPFSVVGAPAAAAPAPVFGGSGGAPLPSTGSPIEWLVVTALACIVLGERLIARNRYVGAHRAG